MIRRRPTLLVPTRGEIEAAWQAARGNKSEVVLCECLFYICNYLCLTICTEAMLFFSFKSYNSPFIGIKGRNIWRVFWEFLDSSVDRVVLVRPRSVASAGIQTARISHDVFSGTANICSKIAFQWSSQSVFVFAASLCYFFFLFFADEYVRLPKRENE